MAKLIDVRRINNQIIRMAVEQFLLGTMTGKDLREIIEQANLMERLTEEYICDG